MRGCCVSGPHGRFVIKWLLTVTHDNACIFFILHKAVVQPHKLFMLSNTREFCLLECLESSLSKWREEFYRAN